MVGHSQLDSDMLGGSPTPSGTADDSVIQHTHAHAAAVALPAESTMVSDDDTDAGAASGDEGPVEAGQECLSSPEGPQAALQGSPMHVPRPGRKRKRSGSRRGCRQAAATVSVCLCKLLFYSDSFAVRLLGAAPYQLRGCWSVQRLL